MHLRTTKGVQIKNENQEEFAWHGAHKLHKELFKTNGHCKDVQKKKTTSEVMSSTEAKNTATGLAIHAKESVYTVGCGAALHMMDYLL